MARGGHGPPGFAHLARNLQAQRGAAGADFLQGACRLGFARRLLPGQPEWHRHLCLPLLLAAIPVEAVVQAGQRQCGRARGKAAGNLGAGLRFFLTRRDGGSLRMARPRLIQCIAQGLCINRQGKGQSGQQHRHTSHRGLSSLAHGRHDAFGHPTSC